MKARIAMFEEGINSGWLTPFSQPAHSEMGDAWRLPGYTRVSEWVDVEFPELPPWYAQLTELDRRAEEVKAEFTAKLRVIDEARASLLALTHEVAK